MISDRKKLLMLRVCAWLFANKSLAPHDIIIEGIVKYQFLNPRETAAGRRSKPWKANKMFLSLMPRNRL